MNNLSPINDLSSKTYDELFSRFQDLDLDCLLVYVFNTVNSSALVHLAEQFHITGNEGWLNCASESERRELLKNSIKLHKFRGTKYALIRVLNILGLNGTVQEWFDYGGEPYHFKIGIDMNNKAFDSETESSLIELIEANKNVRSKLEKMTVNLISTEEQIFASYCTTSEEVTV
jgi:phage tail P2-like protein